MQQPCYVSKFKKVQTLGCFESRQIGLKEIGLKEKGQLGKHNHILRQNVTESDGCSSSTSSVLRAGLAAFG